MYQTLHIDKLDTNTRLIKEVVDTEYEHYYKVLVPIDYYKKPVFLYEKDQDGYKIKGTFQKVRDRRALKELEITVSHRFGGEPAEFRRTNGLAVSNF